MSNDSDLTVRTKDDFERNAALMKSEEKRLRELALKKNWSEHTLNKALVDTLLPYYKANTDPASLAASQALREELLNFLGGGAFILDTQQVYKNLYTAIDNQTNALNRLHGVSYAHPPIIIVDGLAPAPIKFDYDAILINKEYFEEFKEDPYFIAGLAHELAHRYQRDDDYLSAKLGVNQLKFELSENVGRLSKVRETEADFDAYRAYHITNQGALIEGAFIEFLKDTTKFIFPNALVLGYYMASHPELTSITVASSWNALPPDQKEKLEKEVQSLAQDTKDKYFKQTIAYIDASGLLLAHPKIRERLELQAALAAHPEILNATHIKFDGNANITEIEVPGHKYTRSEINQINRDGDAAFAKESGNQR